MGKGHQIKVITYDIAWTFDDDDSAVGRHCVLTLTSVRRPRLLSPSRAFRSFCDNSDNDDHAILWHAAMITVIYKIEIHRLS